MCSVNAKMKDANMEKIFPDYVLYKQRIREMKIDRRELARKIGVAPNYLNQMLSGWAPLKIEYETIIKKVLKIDSVKGKP